MPRKRVRRSSPQSNFLDKVDLTGFSISEVPEEFETVEEFLEFPKPINKICCPDCGAKGMLGLMGIHCPNCVIKVPHLVTRAKRT